MSWDRYDYPPRRNSPALLILAVVIGIAVGVGILALVRHWVQEAPAPLNDPNAAPRVPEPKTDYDYEEAQAIRVFDSSRESVVNVDTVQKVMSFDAKVQERQTGTGSGFVWDEDGRIVTNFHVIAAARNQGVSIRVVLSDRNAYPADIVGLAPDFDLAVLKVDAPKEKLKPIKLGTSKDLKVGQKVFAIGNPFGLSMTMTKGIISALDREIESPGGRGISGAIQLDAPINPGNSGGPLLDKDGRLIGVNSSITTPSGGNVGIGFAIPVDTVNEVVPRLIADGKLPRPDLGVKLVDPSILFRAGIRQGAMIAEVIPGGPADAAGLRGLVMRANNTADRGDLILAVDGVRIGNNNDLLRAIAKKKIGDKVKLTVERDKKQVDVDVTVRGG